MLFMIASSVFIPLQYSPEPMFMNAWINEGEYYDRVIKSSAGLRIYGNFTVNKGEYIKFFICDDGNLSEWIEGHPVQVYDHQEVYDFYSFDFTAPYGDTWHLIFSNVNLTSTGQRQITGYVTMLPPDRTLPSTLAEIMERMFLLYYSMIAIAGMVVIAIVLFLVKRKGHRASSY